MTEKDSLIQKDEKQFVFTSFYKVLAILIVIVVAIIVGNTLFGTRSLEVLFQLDKQEQKLKQRVYQEQVKNKNLHKKLLELNLVIPDEK